MVSPDTQFNWEVDLEGLTILEVYKCEDVERVAPEKVILRQTVQWVLAIENSSRLVAILLNKITPFSKEGKLSRCRNRKIVRRC